MRTRRLPLTLALAGALMLTAACGGGSGDGASPSAGASGSGASGEMTSIKVGVLPIVDTAAIWLGKDKGIFEQHGLDVTLEVAQGGAAVVPAVVAGEYQFGFSNVTSLIVAASKGLPLQIVAPGNFSTGDTKADIGAVVTKSDSGITSPADLAGKTVAVNTLNNIGTVTVSEVVEQAGGDPSTIKFVEMGFPDMPAALSSGRVDAAWVLEPFLTIAKNQGATVVTSNFAEVDPKMQIAAYFTTKQYAQTEPDTTKAFTDAMTESLDYAEAHPDEARAILSTYTEIDPEVQKAMTMPKFSSQTNTDSLQQMADLALKYKVVDKKVDTAELLP
ncbi:ABC transporter substrate-binding protein [Georgenia ruanii]|uniref:PhnD/SsuA/transferrin family substrate-binding protein n=1 Tax=Georgenia ruanii TaxID=348442 RepID=A0A7J9UVS9_9MICO|nr:ABC transporter substrate-binding protein [Georgenia ruanii]MPV88707.1 PhnD/SsuA/transferrin family substrate-binding protein [Georgenia ruanii]